MGVTSLICLFVFSTMYSAFFVMATKRFSLGTKRPPRQKGGHHFLTLHSPQPHGYPLFHQYKLDRLRDRVGLAIRMEFEVV